MYRSCSEPVFGSIFESPVFGSCDVLQIQQSEEQYRGSSVDTIAFTINAPSFEPAPFSKIPLSKTPHSTPLPSLGSPVELTHTSGTFPETSPSTFPRCMRSPLNSFLLPNTDRLEALNQLKNTLTCLSQEIDFTHSSDRIDGLVFLSNQCVQFAIHIHHDAEGVCVEYRRLSGDSIASARFWTQIQDLLRRKERDCMDMDIDAEPLSELELPPQELDSACLDTYLDQLATTLKNEECYQAEELCCLYDAMATSYALCQRLWAHPTLLSLLIGTLASPDMSLVRSSILVLERLASNVELAALGDLELGHLCALLQHPRVLMRKYAIRLLAQLAAAKSTRWSMQGMTRRHMLQSLESLGNSNQKEFVEEIRAVKRVLLAVN